MIDHCIVQVVDLKRGFVLYQHPTYHAVESMRACVDVAGVYALA